MTTDLADAQRLHPSAVAEDSQRVARFQVGSISRDLPQPWPTSANESSTPWPMVDADHQGVTHE